MRFVDSKITHPIAMKNAYTLIFLFCLISATLAQQSKSILTYQDNQGQHSLGYNVPDSANSKIRTTNGETQGVYSYVDGSGSTDGVQYVADGKSGFRVPPLAIFPVQQVQDSVVSKTSETGGKIENIGKQNIFLKELKPAEKNSIRLDEKSKLQSEEGNSTKSNQAEISAGYSKNENSETVKVVNSENIFEKLKLSSIPVFRIFPVKIPDKPSILQGQLNDQGSSIAPVAGIINDQANVSKDQNERTQVSTKEQSNYEDQSVTIDSADELQLPPLDVSPFRPVYPTFIKYPLFPSIHYIIYDTV